MDSTCWTMIRGAAEGRRADREGFVSRYEPIVRAYLGARWRNSPLIGELDDVVQEVFLDCFRRGGALERADPTRPGGFRAFLYGVTRNVALRTERTEARRRVRPVAPGPLEADLLPNDDDSLSVVFDRAWATELVKRARRRLTEAAERSGEDARRRVEILQMRFRDGMPVREIAKRWGVDPDRVHHEYARAREEFRTALIEVVAFHHPDAAVEAAAEAARLVDLFT